MNTRAIRSALRRRISRGSSQPVRICASRPYSKEGGLMLNRRSPVLILAVWAVSAVTITLRPGTPDSKCQTPSVPVLPARQALMSGLASSNRSSLTP